MSAPGGWCKRKGIFGHKKTHGLKPKTARVIKDGKEKDIPIEEVMKGDLIIMRPGEKLPTDGIIISGSSAIDESMLTGESIPLPKEPGSEVFEATINKSGSFYLQGHQDRSRNRPCPDYTTGRGFPGLQVPDPAPCRQGGVHICAGGLWNCGINFLYLEFFSP